jgi:hypothetical protein
MNFLVVYFAALPVGRLHMVEWWDARTADESERISKEDTLALFGYPSWIWVEGLRKPAKMWIKITGVAAEIGTEHLPKASNNRYTLSQLVL